jgi:probable rRNA maturation factor
MSRNGDGGIDFLNRSGLRIPLSQERMRTLFHHLLDEEGKGHWEISVLFTDNAEMRRLNKQYRGVNKTTDVLSFPQEEGTSLQGGKVLGDIVIALPVCIKQAHALGHGRARELAYLLLHGFLHLCGYDHEAVDGKEWNTNELRLGRLIQPMLPSGWNRRALGDTWER